MGRRRLSADLATVVICVRVTAEQRRQLQDVARDNRVRMAQVIRDAVDEYVTDYREDPVFRRAITSP